MITGSVSADLLLRFLSCMVFVLAGEGQKVMSKVEQWLEHPDFLNVVDPDAGAYLSQNFWLQLLCTSTQSPACLLACLTATSTPTVAPAITIAGIVGDQCESCFSLLPSSFESRPAGRVPVRATQNFLSPLCSVGAQQQ